MFGLCFFGHEGGIGFKAGLLFYAISDFTWGDTGDRTDEVRVGVWGVWGVEGWGVEVEVWGVVVVVVVVVVI